MIVIWTSLPLVKMEKVNILGIIFEVNMEGFGIELDVNIFKKVLL